jgi:alkaline phosphatase D
MLSLLPFLAVAPTVLADWSGNVNYNSPSRRHPGLGIHMPKVLKRQSSPSYMDAGRLNFTHGIASGDPYSDSVILWTRVAPTSDNDLSNVTVSGTVPLYNHNTEEYIEVEAKDLQAFTEYYYQFSVCDSDVKSPLGRTKTAPAADDDITSLGLAVFSCSNFPTGEQSYYMSG